MNPFLMIQADQADVQTAVDTMAAVASPERITLWDMTLKGGWIMLVLACLLALAIYIAVERYLALRQAIKTDNDDLFMNSIREYIHKGDVDGARSLSKSTNSPLARMVDKGLSRLGRPLSDIQAAIENEGKLEVARLEKRVSLVATVASLGPMIGFLGTVTGMVTCFQDMAFAGNNIDIQHPRHPHQQSGSRHRGACHRVYGPPPRTRLITATSSGQKPRSTGITETIQP